MITAKNYAAQAEKHLRTDFKKHCNTEDYDYFMECIVDKIKDSVHFALPDNGQIFSDKLRGIRGEKVRLPFPKITVEYYSNNLNHKEDAIWASKRLIYAEEFNTLQVYEQIKNIKVGLIKNISRYDDNDIWIIVRSAAFFDAYNVWHPDVLGWVLSPNWDEPLLNTVFDDIYHEPDYETDEDDDGLRMYGFPVSTCPQMLDESIKEHGDDAMQSAIKDIGTEVSALLELVEALSCSNVHHEAIQTYHPNINQRRIKDGKTPFYETRTLWIDVPSGSKDSGDWQGGTHRSPRQHLRRGHIRNLRSGKKVWVNAAVVGAKENGFIKKDYAIKELA
jgi:hypothetical protein